MIVSGSPNISTEQIEVKNKQVFEWVCKFDEGPGSVAGKKIWKVRYVSRWGTRLSFFFYFFRKNLNLYLIPRAKYILLRNWGFFFIQLYSAPAQRKPYGDVCKMNEHGYPRTAHCIRINFFLILFSPHLHVYIKTRANRGISSPPLSFANLTGVFSHGRC